MVKDQLLISLAIINDIYHWKSDIELERGLKKYSFLA